MYILNLNDKSTQSNALHRMNLMINTSFSLWSKVFLSIMAIMFKYYKHSTRVFKRKQNNASRLYITIDIWWNWNNISSLNCSSNATKKFCFQKFQYNIPTYVDMQYTMADMQCICNALSNLSSFLLQPEPCKRWQKGYQEKGTTGNRVKTETTILIFFLLFLHLASIGKETKLICTWLTLTKKEKITLLYTLKRMQHHFNVWLKHLDQSYVMDYSEIVFFCNPILFAICTSTFRKLSEHIDNGLWKSVR
jgi:hypothetical protein